MSTQTARRMDTRKLTRLAMLAAIGALLVAFIEVPLIPAAPFLKYDPADIPILIGTLLFGPVSGLFLTVIISFLQSFVIHGSGGPIGFIMHVVATGLMVIVVGNVYKQTNFIVDKFREKFSKGGKVSRTANNLAGSVISLTLGTLAMTIGMIFMNLLLTPLFMGSSIEDVIALLIPAIIPFNLLKAGINSAIAFVVFKPIEMIMAPSGRQKAR